MGLTKINKILKKYKLLHKNHRESWEIKQQQIRDGKSYYNIAANHALEGANILNALMDELKNQEIFPKKNKLR